MEQKKKAPAHGAGSRSFFTKRHEQQGDAPTQGAPKIVRAGAQESAVSARPAKIVRAARPTEKPVRGDKPARPVRAARPTEKVVRGDKPVRSARPVRAARSAEKPTRSTEKFVRGDKPVRSAGKIVRGDKPVRSARPVKIERADKAEKFEKRPAAPRRLPSEMRLNRFIALSGVCSRREADNLIAAGEVTVNGVMTDQLGTKVKTSDEIRLNGELLRGEKKVYIVLNKPKGYVTTLEDPHADRKVMDLLKGQVKERVYPVGRLDKNTTGVLLLTNDGELTKELTHPSFGKKKIYHVFLDKPLTENDMERLLTGFELEDGPIRADAASYVDDRGAEAGVELHSGRNRIVRRMFEFLGYEVVKLDRAYFAGLTKMGLRRGFWRHLTPREVSALKSGSYE